MSRIYFRVFGTSTGDQEQDAILDARLNQLSFIQPEHLEILDVHLDTPTFERAKNALCEIANCKVPLDKVDCVVECCRAIHDLIRESKETTLRIKHEASGAPLDESSLKAIAQEAAASAGADEFLPIFIYVVLKANPKQLNSSIQYVQRFRYYLRMGSEGGCFFTHLSSAVYFLENLNSDSLNIDAHTFEYYINGCKATGLRVSAPPKEKRQLFDDQGSDEVEKSTGGDIFLPAGDKDLSRERTSSKEVGDAGLNEDAGLKVSASGGAWLKRSLFSEEGKDEEGMPSSEASWMALLNTMDNDLESDNLFAGLEEEGSLREQSVGPAAVGTPEAVDGEEEDDDSRVFGASYLRRSADIDDMEMSALLREVQEGLDTPLFPDEESVLSHQDSPEEAAEAGQTPPQEEHIESLAEGCITEIEPQGTQVEDNNRVGADAAVPQPGPAVQPGSLDQEEIDPHSGDLFSVAGEHHSETSTQFSQTFDGFGAGDGPNSSSQAQMNTSPPAQSMEEILPTDDIELLPPSATKLGDIKSFFEEKIASQTRARAAFTARSHSKEVKPPAKVEVTDQAKVSAVLFE